jgi:ABC-2 type transport system permease protein
VTALRRLWRAYPTLLRIGLAEAVAYRAEFLVWMLSMTMPLVMLAIMSAMAREAPVGRFDAHGFLAYYLVTLLVRQLAGAWVVWQMIQEIKDGTLSLRLLRPLHPLAAYSAESIAAMPMRALISAPVTVLLLIFSAGSDLSHDPVNIACFVLSIPGAWLINFSMGAMIGTLTLYIESSSQIWELWQGCFMLFSGYLMPLALFPHWLERVARVTPFPFLQAVPVEMLTGLRDRHAALVGLGIQYAWAIGLAVAMLFLWKRAVRRFVAFGG